MKLEHSLIEVICSFLIYISVFEWKNFIISMNFLRDEIRYYWRMNTSRGSSEIYEKQTDGKLISFFPLSSAQMVSERSCGVIKSLEREFKRMKEKTRGERVRWAVNGVRGEMKWESERGRGRRRTKERRMRGRTTQASIGCIARRSTYFLPGPHNILLHWLVSPLIRRICNRKICCARCPPSRPPPS